MTTTKKIIAYFEENEEVFNRTSSRLDTSALKKALPDIAAQYTKTTTSRHFVLA